MDGAAFCHNAKMLLGELGTGSSSRCVVGSPLALVPEGERGLVKVASRQPLARVPNEAVLSDLHMRYPPGPAGVGAGEPEPVLSSGLESMSKTNEVRFVCAASSTCGACVRGWNIIDAAVVAVAPCPGRVHIACHAAHAADGNKRTATPNDHQCMCMNVRSVRMLLAVMQAHAVP